MSLASEPTTKTVFPRQRRALATREAILAAVERIVEKEGGDAVTTTRVAAEIGVAVGTIYRYFESREAMLLEAYDATVTRIAHACGEVLAGMDPATEPREAARLLLGIYLETAESLPAHAGLLRAMRAIRPVEADQSGNNEVTIVGDIVAPFLEKFTGAVPDDPARLHFLSVLLGTLVDLYLVSAPDDRPRLRGEIEAHMLLALERISR